MAIDDVTRRTFVKRWAAVGGGIALGGPLSALAAQTAQGRIRRATGYGALLPTPEEDSGVVYLELPKGFRYRVISRDNEPMSDGNPTPGIFDGTGAYPGPRGTTILVRNHENRSRANEIPVVVPAGKRYDPDPNVRGGNTKLVVDSRSRRVIESFAVLAGTHTNCAGGVTPWGSWITCEEIFNYGSVESNTVPGSGVPHGYCFEIPAAARGPVQAVPIVAAGRFAHEAVAWLGGMLYETEDRGDAAFYRYIPDGRVRERTSPAPAAHSRSSGSRSTSRTRRSSPAASRPARRRRPRTPRSSRAPRASGCPATGSTSTARRAARQAPASCGSTARAGARGASCG